MCGAIRGFLAIVTSLSYQDLPRIIGAENLLLKLATPAVNGHIDSNMYVIYTILIIGALRIMLITYYKLHMQVKRS